MTRKIRRLIFYIFLVLFIILAAGVILYAQGYSFDWKTKSLVVTGAFYFNSYPKKADIYIDDEYWGKTNKFIKRLLPEEHNVRIVKDDYYDWQKKLKINSKLVTEAKNVLLIKKNPLVNQFTDFNIKYLSLSNDNRRAIYLTEPQFNLRLIDFTNNSDEQVSLSLNLSNLSNISWSFDNEKLLLSFPDNYYYILDFKNQLKIINLNETIKVLSKYKIYSIENLLFHPQNSNKIYFYSGGSLYFIELNSANPNKSLLSPPLISDILTYAIHNNEILYIECFGEDSIKRFCGAYKTNFEISSFGKIFSIPSLPAQGWSASGGKSERITIINDELIIIDSNLYLFEPQTQVLTKIAENIEEVGFSEDEKKLFWRTENEIGVIWLEEESQPQRKKYETEVIVKTPKKINQAAWYSKTNQHIVFIVEDSIKVIELDNRDKRNTMNIYSVKKPRIFYNKWNEDLYALSEEQLFEIEMSN